VLDEPVAHCRAMEVHREIGVAVGIIMVTGNLTTEAAYHRERAGTGRKPSPVTPPSSFVATGYVLSAN
jgi:hypothetical protein